MRYFAYGSNLCQSRLVYRGTRPSNPRVVQLPGYRLGLHKLGDDGSAKATIHEAASCSEVWGVIFDMQAACREGLRQAEGFPEHYREEQVHVVGAGGEPVEATTYIAQPARLVDGLQPYGWYIQHIIMGARHFGLPAHYLQGLESIKSRQDPDAVRDRRERAFWQDRQGRQ